MNEFSLFRCLGEATRLTILKALRDAPEASVGELVAATGKEQTNVSHHLAQLRACGLVSNRPEGKRVLYRLSHPGLASLIGEAEKLALHIEVSDEAACQEAGCC